MFLSFATTYLAKIITDHQHQHQHCHKVAISSSHLISSSSYLHDRDCRLQELNYCFSASPKLRLLCSCLVIKRTCYQQHCLSGSFLWSYKTIKTPHFIIPPSTFDSKCHHCHSICQPSPVNFSSEFIYVVRALLHFILSQEWSETQSPPCFLWSSCLRHCVCHLDLPGISA